jgi:hypothetical protein
VAPAQSPRPPGPPLPWQAACPAAARCPPWRRCQHRPPGLPRSGAAPRQTRQSAGRSARPTPRRPCPAAGWTRQRRPPGRRTPLCAVCTVTRPWPPRSGPPHHYPLTQFVDQLKARDFDGPARVGRLIRNAFRHPLVVCLIRRAARHRVARSFAHGRLTDTIAAILRKSVKPSPIRTLTMAAICKCSRCRDGAACDFAAPAHRRF